MSFNLVQTFVNPFLISDYFPGFAIRVLVEIHIESVDWSAGSVWLNMGVYSAVSNVWDSGPDCKYTWYSIWNSGNHSDSLWRNIHICMYTYISVELLAFSCALDNMYHRYYVWSKARSPNGKTETENDESLHVIPDICISHPRLRIIESIFMSVTKLMYEELSNMK